MSKELSHARLYKIAQAPFAWLSVADDLARAAEAVFSKAIGLEAAYSEAYAEASKEIDAGAPTAEIKAEAPRYLPGFLLYGYALENLLKGLLAAHFPEKASEISSAAFKGHLSPEFAEEASFPLTEDQARLVKRLGAIVIWRGRYPVPLKISEQIGLALDREAIVDPSVDIDAVRQLYDKMWSALELYIGKRWAKHDMLISVPN